MNRFERHPVLTLTIILLALVTGLLAATEAFLRWREPVETVIMGTRASKPARAVRLREWAPNTRFVASPPEIRRLNPGGPVHDLYELKIDSDGFIEPSRVHADPDLTIVFLGGSTTESLYVTPEARFPARTARIMTERTGLKVNGLNAARSGNDMVHLLHLFTGKVIPLRPDFVVVMENVNDRGILGRYGTYWNDDKSQSVVTAPRASVEDGLRQIRDALIPRTYRALKRLMDSARAEFDAPPAPRSRLSADEYKRALRTLVRVAKTWDIRPVLLTQVMLSEEQGGRGTGRADDYLAAERLSAAGVDPAAQEKDHARFNDVVRRVAAEEGALLIDLAADPGWRAEHFYDRLHFTDSGSIRAADIVASRLLAILEEEPGRP